MFATITVMIITIHTKVIAQTLYSTSVSEKDGNFPVSTELRPEVFGDDILWVRPEFSTKKDSLHFTTLHFFFCVEH